MKYIAIITWWTGIEWVYSDDLPSLTRWAKPHPARLIPKQMDIEPCDLPARYTAIHMSTIVRVATPDDMVYISAGYEPGERYPMWLAPSGVNPLKPIVKSNVAVISD